MKIISFLFLFYQFSFSQIFQIDTITFEEIRKNLFYTKIRINDLHNVNVLQIDPTFFTFETFRPNLLQTTSEQIKLNNNFPDIVAAINGDFFSFETGWPLNPQISNKIPVLLSSSNKHQIIFSDAKLPKIASIEFNGEIITSDTIINFTNVNGNKFSKSISFHNNYSNNNRIDSTCKIIYLNQINTSNNFADTLYFTISNFSENILSIPNNIFDVLKNKFVDTIKIFHSIKPEIKNINNLISGTGLLLANNSFDSTIWYEKEKVSKSFVHTNHPRTVFAINKNLNLIYFIVVDGRQQTSTGMTFYQLIDFLKYYKITDALNLDGGGSSTLLIDGIIKNSPSDILGERKVANSILLVQRKN